MPNIITNGYGHLSVRKLEPNVGNGPGKVVSVKTGSDPADLTNWELFEFIRTLLNEAGVVYDTDPKNGAISFYRPLSPAEIKRRDELANRFGSLGEHNYSSVSPEVRRAIDYIIDGEIKRGEL